MNTVSKIHTTKEKVIELLTKYAVYKDDDLRLCAHFLFKELEDKKINPEEMSALEFLQRYAKGKFTDTGTITRARRLVQNEFPELRGAKWKERHEEEREVRKNINKNI